ncbi:MAG TPA: tRNA pseudouridine(55) synthase TruB [Fibrobacteria bacterium]|nr:tRNA pseudouridine(55) synthase TruB [Fibrobacteria bacterium]
MTSASSHPSGILLLDKPVGESSFQALFPVKRAFGGKKGAKIGHAGTLDPAASGLLVVGVGNATRLLEFLEEMPKSYSFTLKLGVETDTYDLDGEVIAEHDASGVTRADIEALLPKFRGEILQAPPAYSAVKIDGRRAYDRARAGEAVEIAPRRVRVDRLEITSFAPGVATLELDCSKGTYVRSVAHELGQLLGCGAVAANIRRTATGPFRVEDAIAPDAAAPEALLPLSRAVAHLPALRLKDAWIAALRNGNPIPPVGYGADEGTVRAQHVAPQPASVYAVFTPAGELIAVAEVDPLGSLKPRKVFPEAS